MEEISSEKVCVCALNRIFGFKPTIARGLINTFGSACAVFRTDHESIRRLIGPFNGVDQMINIQAIENAKEELEKISRMGYDFICINDPDYPALLKECEDPPIGLYISSISPPSDIFNTRPSIAIVGTRDISPYGREWCRRIVGAIAHAEIKPLIVSGLALGTDITAQAQALDCGLPTLSVMATGIETLYPHQNRHIGETIERTPGCALITDYPTGTVPMAFNFLRRNRIIAGMSSATILVESKAQGGGMMTARLAFSYERDVYALPGRVDDIRSQGCNQLIMEKIAEPITDLDELVDKLGLKAARKGKASDILKDVEAKYKGHIPDGNLDDLLDILQLIKNNRGITLDELCNKSEKPYSTIAECTGMLESDGVISIDLIQRCTINLKIV